MTLVYSCSSLWWPFYVISISSIWGPYGNKLYNFVQRSAQAFLQGIRSCSTWPGFRDVLELQCKIPWCCNAYIFHAFKLSVRLPSSAISLGHSLVSFQSWLCVLWWLNLRLLGGKEFPLGAILVQPLSFQMNLHCWNREAFIGGTSLSGHLSYCPSREQKVSLEWC